MRQKIVIPIFVVFILISGFSTIYYKTTQQQYVCSNPILRVQAGQSLLLKFKAPKSCQLFINHSYGKTIIDGKLIENQIVFEIPKNYTKKTGDLSWYLIDESMIVKQGNIEVYPTVSSKKPLEAYLGPPSILVGSPHFVMFVTIPTDIYDNPLPANTPVVYKNHFKDFFTNNIILTKNLIAWHNVYAPKQSGKIFLSAEVNSNPTKEYEAFIYPNVPTDFTINYERPHSFADGNQITTFTTSVIKDKFGNIVSDGTQVNFVITTLKGTLITTRGTTLKGVANAQVLHPDHLEKFIVKANVNGMAQSNNIVINYKVVTPVIHSVFTSGRVLEVGPVMSYMNQLVPDGIAVNVKVYKRDMLVSEIKKNTMKGIVYFNFSKEQFKEGDYIFKISVLGKTIVKHKKLYGDNK